MWKKMKMVVVLMVAMATVSSAALIDQQQLLHNSQTAFSGFVAQTVSPARNYLYSVDLVLYATSTHNPTVTLEIRGADQNYAAPSQTVLLGSVTKTMSGTGYNWQTFDFSASPIDIRNYNTSQGAGRIMLLARAAAGSVNNIVRWQSSVSTYPAGELFLTSSDTRYNGDMAFKVWTDVVPEPATMMLLALGSCVLARKHSRF